MAAVSQSVPTFLGGTSKQIDSKKKPGQVRECINAYPDPTLGLIKRPGTKFIKTLGDTSFVDGKWFYIHRDGDEEYIGCIKKGTPGAIQIWNAISGVECTVHDHSFYITVNALSITYPFNVTATDNNNYTIAGQDRTGVSINGTDPALTFHTGDTINFTLLASAVGHPFYIKTAAGAGTDNQVAGVTNQGANTENAVVSWTPTSPGTYYYQCGTHADMSGTITITGEGVTKRNVPTTGGTGTGMTLNIIATNGLIVDAYTCSPGTGYAVNDVVTVAAADAGTTGDLTFNIGAISTHYLQPSGSVDDNPNINYHVLSVQDTTIITNKTTIVTPVANPTYTANTKATIRLKQVRYGCRYDFKINGTQSSAYTTLRADDDTGTQVLNSDDILDQIITRLGAMSVAGLSWTKLPSSIELTSTAAFTVEAIDDQGGANMEAFSEQVNVVSDLPNQSRNGRIVKVVNTDKDNEQAYWAKFFTEDNSLHGPGYWEETVDPKVSTGLTNHTMPHELKNTSKNIFDYKGIDWKDRIVGDDETNSHPSFVDTERPTTIQQCFLYNTRLGFLTRDNVSLSQAQDYYNFYYTTAVTSLASDPIDLSCSSIRPASLHGVIPTAQGLILFSKNQQFMMFAPEGPLTPATAIIRSISNYEMDTNIDPVDVGTNINFVSKTPSYSRIFGMQTRGYEESPIIQDISRAVSQWIPETIDNIFSSPQNSLTGVFSKELDTLYLYRVYNVGKEQLMQAWFEWKLPGKLQHVTVDNDTMWIVVLNNNKIILLKASVSKSTTEDVIVTNDGLQVNPHMDMFTPASSVKYKEVTGFQIMPPSTHFPGYESPPTLTISPPADPNGVTATATCKVVGQNGVTASGYDQLWAGGDPSNLVTAPLRSIVDVTITNPGSGYTSAPQVEVGKPWEPNTAYGENDQYYSSSGRLYQCVTTGGGTSGTNEPVHTTIYNYLAPDDPGENSDDSDQSDGTLMWRCMGFKGVIHLTVDPYDGSRCYLPYEDIPELKPVIVVKGSGVTESGFTITPERKTDSDGNTYFGIPKLNFTPTPSDIYIGYQYNYDIELPKTYYRLDESLVDYTANLTIARMKFAVGLSSGIGFKLRSKGFKGDSFEFTGTGASTTDTSGTDHIFTVPFPLKEENDVVVKVNGAKQLINTAYTFTNNTSNQGVVTFKSGYVPTEELSNNDNTTSPAQTVEISIGNWYDVQPVQDANQYLADDVPLVEESIFTIPVHQRTDNFSLRVFSNSPFPVSLNSMMWEGNYSPRYYRRT